MNNNICPKFIIETHDKFGNCLIIAKCTFHKQLVTNVNNVKGGGFWELDYENKVFTLHGESHDFGKAKIIDIALCVQTNNVYNDIRLRRNLSNNFMFNYKNETGEIIGLENYILPIL